jgi:NitT/TauT family transport system substrate-binding protein
MPKVAGVDSRVISACAGVAFLGGLTLFGGQNSATHALLRANATQVNLGYFANVTHSPALIGVADGEFQKAFGASADLNPKVMGAGPEAMEALLAGDIDIAYVGPSPAINTYIKTGGKALRIVAGACEGGASLVATRASGIHSVKDLAGKRIAVPQIGNTQDVSLRHFLKLASLTSKEAGGDVDIIPAANADTLNLFRQRAIDAAWLPEPWATRLVSEVGAVRVLDERTLWPGGSFASAVIVVRTAFADAHPDLVSALVNANSQVIAWMAKNPARTHVLVNNALYDLSAKHNPHQVPEDAWQYLRFSSELRLGELVAAAEAARDSGYLKSLPPNLAEVYDPRFLKQKGARVAQ